MKKVKVVSVNVMCSSSMGGNKEVTKAEAKIAKAVDMIEKGFSKISPVQMKEIKKGLKMLGSVDHYPSRWLNIGGTLTIDLSKKATEL